MHYICIIYIIIYKTIRKELNISYHAFIIIYEVIAIKNAIRLYINNK